MSNEGWIVFGCLGGLVLLLGIFWFLSKLYNTRKKQMVITDVQQETEVYPEQMKVS